MRRTLALARARGYGRIVLAGLSNGGAGAATLAPRLRGQIAGLVLVSGVAPGAPDPGVPVLGYFLWERLRGMRLWAVLRALGAVAIAIAVSGDGHGWLDIAAACAFALALSAAVIGTPGRLRLVLGSLAFAAYALPTAAAVVFVWMQAAR